MFQEQAIRSGGGGMGGGKNYDSVGNNDRDGYGQPDGTRATSYFYLIKTKQPDMIINIAAFFFL